MSTTTDPAPTSDRLWPAATPALVQALDRQVGFDARWGGGFSNHLPMELIALDAMGASTERLEEMLSAVSSDLSVRVDTAAFDAFRAEIAADGIDATVARHLPRFAEMPSSEWFHSMIRLSYALDARHDGQVASALADWTAYGKVLPGEPPEGGADAVIEVLRRLEASDLASGPGIADLAGVAHQDRFREVVAPVVVDVDLTDLAEAVAVAHVGGSNFGTLHLVTGVQAARTVRHLLSGDLRRRFARRVVQAATAGYVASGATPLPSADELEALRRADVPRWDEVRAAAVASPDVHVTKLVYSCRTEQAATGDPLYAWIAARAVELV